MLRDPAETITNKIIVIQLITHILNIPQYFSNVNSASASIFPELLRLMILPAENQAIYD